MIDRDEVDPWDEARFQPRAMERGEERGGAALQNGSEGGRCGVGGGWEVGWDGVEVGDEAVGEGGGADGESLVGGKGGTEGKGGGGEGESVGAVDVGERHGGMGLVPPESCPWRSGGEARLAIVVVEARIVAWVLGKRVVKEGDEAVLVQSMPGLIHPLRVWPLSAPVYGIRLEDPWPGC